MDAGRGTSEYAAPWEKDHVEHPPLCGKVHPGHLWHREADPTTKIWQIEDLANMMVELRSDMSSRFDAQEIMLNSALAKLMRDGSLGTQPSCGSGLGGFGLRNSASPNAETDEAEGELVDTEESDATASGTGAPATKDTPASSMSSEAEAEAQGSKRRSGLGKFFSTFEREEEALQEIAYARDAMRARSRFATKRSGKQSSALFAQRIVKNNAFDLVCAFVVVSNCLYLGIDVEVRRSHAPAELPLFTQVIPHCYAAWFLLELTLRILAEGCYSFFFSDDWMWSILDLFVVLTSLWDVAADILIAFQNESVSQVEGMSSFKAFRIVRITRIVKVVRLMRVFRFVLAFRTLIASIADTLKSLFWALMLLATIVYVFAVLFTQAVNDFLRDESSSMSSDEEELAMKYFASLGDTMLSLFMAIANGVSWKEVLAPLRRISPLLAALFLFYIFFTLFAVLNVVTAVFCQTAVESAQSDHAAMVHSVLKNKKAHCDKIRRLFHTIGDKDAGVITFKVLEEKLLQPNVRAYFEVLGLDVWDVWSFYKLLDNDRRGDVEIEQFLMGCLRLRGSARAIDVGKLIHDQAWLIKTQSQFQRFVEKQLRKMRRELQSNGPSPGYRATVNALRAPTT
ncbi:unnamed protein product [Effrenium voratum]|nr:unnamed protein product [Effrenium voratum]CAJ1457535.1 unnamed protein product [Effrenium voratum]